MSQPLKQPGLPLDGKIDFLDKLSSDFKKFASLSLSEEERPSALSYEIEYTEEPNKISRSARMAFFQQLKPEGPLVKLAFDTRRIDQEHDRNPRSNLQYWHRSEPFIDNETQEKISIYSKLLDVCQDIKKDFGTQPDYFESYSRQLLDQTQRALGITQQGGTVDVFKPQLAYLEQLLFARYRLTLEELSSMGFSQLKSKILSKDENLMKRGVQTVADKTSQGQIVIDGNSTQQNIIEAIFGNNQLRRQGEKSVTRTITITIKDTAEE